MKKYETMFLFDPTATTDWDAIQSEVQRVLDRAEARAIVISKWDERRLAYEIDKRKRGIYVLTYFEASPEKLDAFERDCKLSEMILRIMVIRAEHLTEDEMKEIAARPVAQEEPRRDYRDDRGGRDRDDRGGRDRDDRGGRDRDDRGGRDRDDRGGRPRGGPADSSRDSRPDSAPVVAVKEESSDDAASSEAKE